MKIANIADADKWFQVLQTTPRSQTAVMRLEPGKASGEQKNTHPDSDQILIVIEGEVNAEIADERATMGKGDVVIVPAGVEHKFVNNTDRAAVTFSVYAPPAYNQ
jgi:mannose-6-phosphate isomerase-like protein (cupin superfamily)